MFVIVVGNFKYHEKNVGNITYCHLNIMYGQITLFCGAPNSVVLR